MRRILLVSMLVGFSCLFLPQCHNKRVEAAELPTKPILRIETGMHTAMINRIALDQANRWLVSTSDDKTLRLWELPAGRLARIFRPPIGEGNEGRLYSVAISSDGRQIACGGWAERDREGANYIYLFDRASGRMAARITGLTGMIHHLAYSADGRYIAVCMGRNIGVRIYETEGLQPVAEDRDYGGESCGADFSPDGRLVTSSRDGYLRLYNRDFRLLEKKKAPGGLYLFQVSFSPDGRKIAVVFQDSTNVDVLSGIDLSSFRYSPDTVIHKGDSSNVSWSADSRFLYSWSIFDDGKGNPVIRWADAGRETSSGLFEAPNAVFGIRPLEAGGFGYGSGDPVWGIHEGSGIRKRYLIPGIADYRAGWEGFLVSTSGACVQFGYEYGGKSPARFSVDERLLKAEPARNAGLLPPVAAYSGLDITDWKNHFNPRFNGDALKLEPYERSRSLAIVPGGAGFLLGTDRHLRLFDRKGREQWRAPVQGSAWAVNIAGNGKVAIAALADGTIRWHRLSDGRELLAFFPHRDRKRWIAWSPSGYYDASPGAEELIGWHLNRGKDQTADFFPASRFRSICYRPDVIAGVIQYRDEQKAVMLSDETSGRRHREPAIEKMLPPVVTILSPSDGSAVSTREVVLTFALRSPSGEPVTSIRALVDGRPVLTKRKLSLKPRGELTQTIRVAVPEKDAEVSLIAANRHAASVPFIIRLHWKGKASKESAVKPNLYVLAVGVSQYRDRSLRLGFAAKDAQDFAEFMKQQKEGLYRDVAVRILTDRLATKYSILDGLAWIRRETTSQDIAMIYLSGYGMNDPAGIFHFLPVNARIERLERTGVAFSQIRDAVASPAGKVVLFLDARPSGNETGPGRVGANITAVVNELAAAENGAVVFAASTGKQHSMEDKAWENGAFARALLEGMGGRADDQGKGSITIHQLDRYLFERVKQLTGGRQTPAMTQSRTIRDFPVALK